MSMIRGTLTTQAGCKNWYALINFGSKQNKWYNLKMPIKGTSKAKAKKAMKELIHKLQSELNAGVEPQRVGMLLVDAVEAYLECKDARIKESSKQGYRIYIRAYIKPYFEPLKLKLSEVQTHHIEAFYKHLYTKGRTQKKGGLTVKSIQKIAPLLKGTFDDAIKNRQLQYNPVILAEYPKERRKAFEAGYYTFEQTRMLLEAVKGKPMEPIVLLAATYGLRRSEILGLRWQDVDFANNTIHIQNTVTKVEKAIEEEDTKNIPSNRVLPLKPIRDYLVSLKEKQAQAEREQKSSYKKCNKVCRLEDGSEFAPDSPTRRFNTLLRQLGFPKIRLHDLRHSVGTNLHHAGYTLVDVGAYMGHGDPRTTAKYVHASRGAKNTLASAMGAALFGQSTGQ